MKPQVIVCSFSEAFVDMRPYGAAVWMEFHHYIGPVFYRSKRGMDPMEPGKKCWEAYEKWAATPEGKRIVNKRI